MAKYNMMLGVAKGPVGDIVLSRRDGVQIQRVRVHEVANPQTQGQAAQRSFIAPVTKFYSPLAVTLERSWEGKNKSKSYNAFLKFNTNLARNNAWALPKGCSWFPLPYRLSFGTITPLYLVDSWSEGTYSLEVHASPVSDSTLVADIATFSKALINAGYKKGDQITVILAKCNDYEQLFADGNYTPKVIRFYLDPSDTTTFASMGLSVTSQADSSLWTISEANCVGGAVIVSRYEQGVWRRSTQSLMVIDYIMDKINNNEQRQRNIDTYRPASLAPVSDVYLNGSEDGGRSFVMYTPSGKAYTIVNVLRNESWAIAVANSGERFYLYSSDRRSAAYTSCLVSNGQWAQNSERTDDNCVICNCAWSSDPSGEVLQFMMSFGFTQVMLYGEYSPA